MQSPDRARIDLLVVLGGMVALNVVTAQALDSWPEAAAHVLGAAAAVAYAMWRGYSADDLGLGREAVGSGVRVGAALGAIIVAGVTALALVPFSSDFLDDDRFDQLSNWEALYEILVRIPFVTALTEELLFRAVLLAVLLAMTSTKVAVLWSSVVFGLWHALTALNGLDGNEATDSFDGWAAAGSVVAVVLATGVAGVLFAWSRLRSNSVVAPWIVHIAFNSSTFTAGVLLAR
jgi:uncharacterized protein